MLKEIIKIMREEGKKGKPIIEKLRAKERRENHRKRKSRKIIR